ncbi:hypothetical protein H6G97_44275 [Nostoc flagelliforme FACHB-838]|uniref:Transposase n=1 Tax=Nostoc flagelliforme FACHB-838 TaxID=2692904 RepID=A0ABR8E322_9NOSO|nr:hypothetical protein [Nostoc flagelliforme]MBD2535971.1 hypothetical protein [Nostoc flagelliforme FACHB-838]
MIDLHSEQTKLSGRWIQKGFLAIAVLFNFKFLRDRNKRQNRLGRRWTKFRF